ncbi:MAG: DNA replication/repair protein RecF, partial [Hyphomicrobiaceae bacterium]|nr:DNA replication/repair protein RecF [Hyphomicrobiaceae bacterium]
MSENAKAPADCAAPRAVRVTTLALTGFRNHAETRIDLPEGPVVITGPNGAGKTNILEAVSLLAPGRGLRRARLEAMAAKGTESFSLFFRLEGGGAEEPVAIGTGLEAGRAGRVLRIDGAPAASQEALCAHAALAWLTPAMDGLFTAPASERRRFLDRLTLALHPAHGRVANAYERALRERNRLLGERIADPHWFEGLEAELAAAGACLAAARADCLTALKAENERRAGTQSAFPHAALTIEGMIEAVAAEDGVEAAEDALRERLREGRPRDREAGRTLEGPHRSDLLVRHGPKDMEAALSSTGEQKALLVGLILAQGAMIARRTGLRPILLLDEIAAHFDAARRAGLFAELDALGGQ